MLWRQALALDSSRALLASSAHDGTVRLWALGELVDSSHAGSDRSDDDGSDEDAVEDGAPAPQRKKLKPAQKQRAEIAMGADFFADL
jgi:hypothetical protein